jgi:hypothetical protein
MKSRNRRPEDPSEGVGFEPTVRFPVRLISSQVNLLRDSLFRGEYGQDGAGKNVKKQILA